MVRTLLVRGMLAGVVAALLAFVFAWFFGEPALDGGIAYEDALSTAAGETDGEAPLVSRGTQSTIGLLVALLIYGVAVGGIFALVHGGAQGRLFRLAPRATAGVLALIGYVVVVLVPFLKYPSNPPASSVDDTIGLRSGTFVIMLLLSVVAAIVAVAVGQRLVARIGTWNGVLAGAAVYVVIAGIVAALLPVVSETPADFPAVVLYNFRVATLGIHAVLWAAVGLLFGLLVSRGTRSAERPTVGAGAG
ncbi:CbtA family protein [Pseudonocardia sp. N23]|uniref:CbtA family protein n=1 Tax=Pseudonocardia sp. N23 TaxID=1987376 RepID=UPI000BFD44B6|nr:CbtA family protein [Pseudonocardia sp. N23]GAY12450.1 predicted cobalt transporter CbtA [Pseudonocardia sp. N23]